MLTIYFCLIYVAKEQVVPCKTSDIEVELCNSRNHTITNCASHNFLQEITSTVSKILTTAKVTCFLVMDDHE